MAGSLNMVLGGASIGGGGGVPIPLAVSLNRTYLSGVAGYKGTVVTAQSVTATPSGGTAPYTYLWARVSGDVDIVINSPTADTTTFRYYFASDGVTSAEYRVTVTDAVAGTIASELVYVDLESYG